MADATDELLEYLRDPRNWEKAGGAAPRPTPSPPDETDQILEWMKDPQNWVDIEALPAEPKVAMPAQPSPPPIPQVPSAGDIRATPPGRPVTGPLQPAAPKPAPVIPTSPVLAAGAALGGEVGRVLGIRRSDVPSALPSELQPPPGAPGVSGALLRAEEAAGRAVAPQGGLTIYGAPAPAAEPPPAPVAPAPVPGEEPGVAETVYKGVLTGLWSLPEGLLRSAPMLEAFFGVKVPGADFLEEGADIYATAIEQATPRDPDFLFKFSNGLGSLGAFIVANYATRGAILRLKAPAWIARTLGLSVPVVLESLAEASNTFSDLLRQGVDRRTAATQAGKTFAANVALVSVTNRAGIFSEGGTLASRAGKSFLMEGPFQESPQSVIQDVLTGRPINWWNAFEAGVIGGVLGGGAAVVTGGAEAAMRGIEERRAQSEAEAEAARAEAEGAAAVAGAEAGALREELERGAVPAKPARPSIPLAPEAPPAAQQRPTAPAAVAPPVAVPPRPAPAEPRRPAPLERPRPLTFQEFAAAQGRPGINAAEPGFIELRRAYDNLQAPTFAVKPRARMGAGGLDVTGYQVVRIEDGSPVGVPYLSGAAAQLRANRMNAEAADERIRAIREPIPRIRLERRPEPEVVAPPVAAPPTPPIPAQPSPSPAPVAPIEPVAAAVPTGLGEVAPTRPEETRINVPEAEDFLSRMRVEGPGGEIRAGAAFDPRIVKVLGNTLYSGDLGQITVKEMIQNAVDSIRGVPGGAGRVSVNVDSVSRTFRVDDTGTGMTLAVATKEFLDPGASLKPPEASGGLGIAKVAILGNADRIGLVTTALDPERGGLVTTRLTGSGTDWLAQNLRVESSPAEAGAKTGTSLEIQLGAEARFAPGRALSWLRKFLELQRLQGQEFDFTYDDEPVAATLFTAPQMASVPIPGGTMTIYQGGQVGLRSFVEAEVLNRGLPQFQTTIYLPREVQVPWRILVDISAAGSPEQGDYPFRPDREGLRDNARMALDDWVRRNLFDAGVKRERETYRTMWENAPRIQGTPDRVVDTANRIPPELVAEIATRPYLKAISGALRKAANQVQALLVLRDAKYAHGDYGAIGLGGDYLGVNVPGKFLGLAPPARVILVNPYRVAQEVRQAVDSGVVQPALAQDELAEQLAATLLHELTHNIHPGHESEFAGTLTRNIGRAAIQHRLAVNRLRRALSGDAYANILADLDRISGHWGGEDLFGKIAGGDAEVGERPGGERPARLGAEGGARPGEAVPVGLPRAPAGVGAAPAPGERPRAPGEPGAPGVRGPVAAAPERGGEPGAAPARGALAAPIEVARGQIGPAVQEPAGEPPPPVAGGRPGLPRLTRQQRRFLEELAAGREPRMRTAQQSEALEEMVRRGLIETTEVGPTGFRRFESRITDAGRAALTRDDTAPPAVGEPPSALGAIPAPSEVGAPRRRGAGVRLVGLGISPEARAARADFVEYRGKLARNAREVAELLQPTRDPRWETFRIIYVDDAGNALAVEAVSSRHVRTTIPFLDTRGWNVEAIGRALDADDVRAVPPPVWKMRQRMRRLGATGYWLSHNHPTGRPAPSASDESLNDTFNALVPGLRGHVVIDSGSYGVIEIGAAGPVSEVRPLPTDDRILEPSIPHPILWRLISNPADLALAIADIVRPEGYLSMLYLGSDGRVRAVEEIPVNLFLAPRRGRDWPMADYIRGAKRDYGANEVIAYAGGATRDMLREAGDRLVDANLLTAFQYPGRFGIEGPAARVRETEPGPPFRVQEPEGGEFRAEPGPVFYSQVERVIRSPRVPERGFAPQILAAIENAPGVKPDEIKWLGLRDWLREQGGRKIGKQEVLDFIRANEVRVEEIVRGAPSGPPPELGWTRSRVTLANMRIKGAEKDRLTTDQWEATDPNQPGGYRMTITRIPPRGFVVDSVRLQNAAFDTLDEAKLAAVEAARGRETSYNRPELNLAGGENYREMLLKWEPKRRGPGRPATVRPPTPGVGGWEVYYENGEPYGVYAAATAEEALRHARELGPSRFPRPGTFRGGHFDEPNVLAHIRFDERTDAEGKRVLFIQEVQSDWAQAGRREGFRGELPHPTLTDTAALALTPPAPFVTTGTWHELVMKRMLRWAAENGFDRLAWTTGQQQADRYDLSKRLDRLAWIHYGDDRTYNLVGFRRSEGVFNQTVPEAELDHWVGLDLGNRIRAGEGTPSRTDPAYRDLSGVDLKVGGESLRALYDQMLPQFVNKFAKQWGARAGTTEIPVGPTTARGQVRIAGAGAQPATVRAIDITPSMRGEIVSRGIALFEPAEEFRPRRLTERDIGLLAREPEGGYTSGESGRRLDLWARLVDYSAWTRGQEGGDRQAWEARMRRDLGDAAAPHLDALWAEVSREEETTPAPETPPDAPTADPLSEDPSRAVNINLDRLITVEAVKDEIRQVGRLYREQIQAQRRRTITFDQVRRLAQETGVDAAKLNAVRAGEAWAAEDLLAARRMLVASAQDLHGLHTAAAAGGSDEDMARFVAAFQRHVAIQKAVSGLTAEAGRALAQFRIGASATADAYRRMVDTLGGREVTQEIAERLGRMDPGRVLQLNRFTRHAVQPRFKDKIFEVWINALLSGPRTHVVNVTSNFLFNLERGLVERTAAGAIDWARAAATGTRQERFIGEGRAEAYGLMRGLAEGAHAFAESWRTEMPVFGREREPFLAHPPAVGGRIGAVVRTPTRLLRAEDEFSKAVGYRMALQALAYRRAASEGLVGQAFARRLTDLAQEPDEAMIAEAQQEAKVRTFTDEGSKFARALIRLRDTPVFGFRPLKYIIPFVSTPERIFVRGIERTPLGWVLIAVKQARGIAEERAAAREGREPEFGRLRGGELSDEVAKAAVGTLLSAGMAAMVWAGMGTGGGPGDPADKQPLYATGWQPYAFRLADIFFAYGRLEPFGLVFGTVADFIEGLDERKKVQNDEAATRVVNAVIENFQNKSFLTGLRDASRAWIDPERYGQWWLQGLASTVVPQIAAQTVPLFDPTARRGRTTGQAILARIPGLSRLVPPLRDIWGQPVTRTGLERASRFISPVTISEAKDDPAALELVRLGVRLGRPGRDFEGVRLTDEEHGRYSEVLGRVRKEKMSAVVQRESYAKAVDDQWRMDRIADALRDAGTIAGDRFRREIPFGERRRRKEERKMQRLQPPVRRRIEKQRERRRQPVGAE